MNQGLSHSIGPPLPSSHFPSCWQQMQDAAARNPDKVAVVCLHQPPDLYAFTSQEASSPTHKASPYLRWTYSDFATAGTSLAKNLASRGAGIDTPIVTFIPNGVELVLLVWVASALGARLCPLNPRNLANLPELAHMLNLCMQNCNDKRAIVVADTDTIATNLNHLSTLDGSLKFLLQGAYPGTWQPFNNLLLPNTTPSSTLPSTLPNKATDSATFFTSGTTSLPKAIHLHHPHFPSAMLAINAAAGDRYTRTSSDVFAVVGPNNHLLCHLFLMQTLCAGATLVFPSGSFSPETFLDAVEQEQVTHTAVVPTMVQQIASSISTLQTKIEPPSSLQCIMLGGSGVSPKILHLCTHNLKAPNVEIIYGNTEGVWINSGSSIPSALLHTQGPDVSVGKCPPGSEVKICHPSSKIPVPFGVPGEIHYRSISLAGGYIGFEGDEFYVDDEDGKTWMATGDQATMDSDGRIFIVGRYRDMIIRGGENLSPAAIEICIYRTFPDIEVQVVGKPDLLAGEVPVAVTALPVNRELCEGIRRTVVQEMGEIYALDEVLWIGELGMEEFPRTMAGKVKKGEIRELLLKNKKKKRGMKEETGLEGLLENVKQALARTIGVDSSEIGTSGMELADVGDSISMLRFRDRLAKVTGYSVSVQDIAGVGTVGELVRVLLQLRRSRMDDDLVIRPAALTNPPGDYDLMEDLGHIGDVGEIKELVLSAIKPAGVEWAGVREIFPAYDFTQVNVRNGVLHRWGIKVAIVARDFTVEQLRKALVKALANNPMQASFIVQDDTILGKDNALHVTVDQHPEFLQALFEDAGSIRNVAELEVLTLKDRGYPKWPGPLVRGSLYHVEELSSAAVLLKMHHSVTDASFLQLFCEDVDAALASRSLQPHISYRQYCDSVQALRRSRAAKVAARYHIDRLQGLAAHAGHIWPPRHMPFLPEDGGPDGYVHVFPAGGVLELCRKHSSLAPSLITKAATALFLLRVSKHSHTIFGHVEAGRDGIFPFLPASLATAGRLECSDVGGQLFQCVVNLVSLKGNETVVEFLLRLQGEQNVQHKHAAAPWQEIQRGLGPEAAAVFEQAASWCMFNWTGTTHLTGDKGFEKFEIVSTATKRQIVPFVNNCGLQRGRHGDQIVLHLRGAVFEADELKTFAEEIAAIVVWLVKEESMSLPVQRYREVV